MTNYSILQRNILDSLSTEEARKAFLWASDKPGDALLYRAEDYAREVEDLFPVTSFMVAVAASVPTEHGIVADEEAVSGVVGFILDRHRNWRYPQRRSAA